MKRTKVLIIDDSAIMRKFLTDVLSSSREIEVISTAMNLDFAYEKIIRLQPDIITLNIGIDENGCREFLSRLKSENPLPIIVVSDLSEKHSMQSILAMNHGAVDFLVKPSYQEINTKSSLTHFSHELIQKVLIVSRSNVLKKHKTEIKAATRKIILSKRVNSKIITIGASAGGVETIGYILSNLKMTVPGIVIVQHMPKQFTGPFAENLNRGTDLEVKESENSDRIFPGTVNIAPGDKHLLLSRDEQGYYVTLSNDRPYNRHKPSVDILFNSAAESAGKNATGILLTGMGDDGARGLLRMRESGAATIAQDEKSSIVFGMPMTAIEMNAASMIYNTDNIINYINKL